MSNTPILDTTPKQVFIDAATPEFKHQLLSQLMGKSIDQFNYVLLGVDEAGKHEIFCYKTSNELEATLHDPGSSLRETYAGRTVRHIAKNPGKIWWYADEVLCSCPIKHRRELQPSLPTLNVAAQWEIYEACFTLRRRNETLVGLSTGGQTRYIWSKKIPGLAQWDGIPVDQIVSFKPDGEMIVDLGKFRWMTNDSVWIDISPDNQITTMWF